MSRVTEQRNPVSVGLDVRPIHEILEAINNEDAKITTAIHQQLPSIEAAVENIISTIRAGGDVYLVGAGSSGRLCVLEASEIPPTFGFSPDRIRAVIAGGVEAIYSSIEGAEDENLKAASEMEALGLNESDLVIGVAASGSTPFVLGAIKKARELRVKTVGISCNPDAPLSMLADVGIDIVVGPEVVAGSTRMRAGTAQKMVLNMMTTATMMKLGLVYDGYMVGVQATNNKLKDRSKSIVAEITGASMEEAGNTLRTGNWDVRAAVVVLLTDLSPGEAKEELKAHTLRQIIASRRKR